MVTVKERGLVRGISSSMAKTFSMTRTKVQAKTKDKEGKNHGSSEQPLRSRGLVVGYRTQLDMTRLVTRASD